GGRCGEGEAGGAHRVFSRAGDAQRADAATARTRPELALPGGRGHRARLDDSHRPERLLLVPVTVARRYRGLAFQAVEPGEPGYPPDLIELYCEAHLRTELGLSDGDQVSVWLTDA